MGMIIAELKDGKVKEEREAAKEGCDIGQVTSGGNWGPVLLGKPWVVGRENASVILIKESWSIFPPA